MTRSLHATDIVVGMLTENTSRMLTQAIRLLRSIRWLSGEFAHVRVVVCGVGPLESSARGKLEALGAEIRTVTRFHAANPTGNRHQLIAELLDAPEGVLFLLDCDTIVVRDPLPYLNADGFQAKIAPTPTVSDEAFQRLFVHFKLPMPPRSHITPFSGTPTIPYFNAGVFAVPTALARTLAPVWRKYNQILADQPELVAPCQRHMHQASLSLALAETGVPSVELPASMNFQINATHITPPPGFAETDPVIIHYHHLATEDGFLLPCPYPATQARIEMFHDRMRAEGFVQEKAAVSEEASRAVVVLGMHRSGTSVLTHLVSELGLYAGQPDELMPPDMFNPTGFWEHLGAVKINRDLFEQLGATWTGVEGDLARLSDEQRAGYVDRAKRVVQSLQGRGPFVIKDPRMSLLFPIWREALPNPICVIAWRDPMAVARSLARRDLRPRLLSLAEWEHYNRTLLRDTNGAPRILVSYEALLTDPIRIARELHAALTEFGLEGLRLPSEERIRQIVNVDFNRSGRTKEAEETLLDSEQRALLDDLRTGKALREPVAPTAAHKLELFKEFGEVRTHREQLDDYDELLGAVFESRSWRLGYGMTGLLRALHKSDAPSAVDRWKVMMRRRRRV